MSMLNLKNSVTFSRFFACHRVFVWMRHNRVFNIAPKTVAIEGAYRTATYSIRGRGKQLFKYFSNYKHVRKNRRVSVPVGSIIPCCYNALVLCSVREFCILGRYRCKD